MKILVFTIMMLCAGNIIRAQSKAASEQSSMQPVYLSELEPTISECTPGKPKYNTGFTGNPLSIKNQKFAKGIGTHSDSDIRYIINNAFETFNATIGIDDSARGKGSAVFHVYGDEKLLFTSKTIKGTDAPLNITIDIQGVEEIKLVVTDAGDGKKSDHADWADARIIPVKTANIEEALKTNWEIIGNCVGVPAKDNESYTFQCENAKVLLELCRSDLIRIRMVRENDYFGPNETISIVKYNWAPVKHTMRDSSDSFQLSTDDLILDINKKPFSIAFYEPDGKTLITRQSSKRSMGWSREKRGLWMELDAKGCTEHFYGIGAQDLTFDCRGRTIHNWCGSLHGGSRRGEVYTVVPWFLSTGGYAILLHNSYGSWFKMGSESNRECSIEADNGELDFYFFKGPSFKKIIDRYTELTGRPALPPKYALGLQYRGLGKMPNTWTSDDYINCGRKFRELDIPCDILGTEPGWATMKGNLQWNPATFHDPASFANTMKKMGFHINLWIHQKVTTQDKPFRTTMFPYMATDSKYMDWTMPAAGDEFFNIAGPMVFDKFDGEVGLKEDDHEANFDMKDRFPSGLTAPEYYNMYYMTWTMMLSEQVKKRYNRRYYGLAAPSFTGGQRYTSCGYGDVWKFEDIRRTMINSGFSGIHFVPEVRSGQAVMDNEYMRRSQMVFFSAFPQDNDWYHGVCPWSHGQSAIDNFRQYAKLRYKLTPYIYSCFREQNKTGISIIRPMVLEFQDDSNTYNIDTQYMFGKYLLVAPVENFANECTRPIYLPKGTWHDFATGKSYEGNRTIQHTTRVDTLPLFVRSGAIIPTGPEMSYVDEKPLDPLTLELYPDQVPSEFSLYEDDGRTWDYKKGEYCETEYRLSASARNVQLLISRRLQPGSYRPADRDYCLQFNNITSAGQITINGRPIQGIYNEPDKKLTVKFPDSGTEQLVKILLNKDSS